MSSSSSMLPDYSRPSPVDGYYDVFISFRGSDTRRNFTSYLSHALRRSGIHAFTDDLDLGESIVDRILQIIRQSRIAVVVYSENYASSRWCLKELETIMEQRTHGRMKMIPIFYKVNPAELRQLSGQTAYHLDKHRGRVGESTLQNWKVALTQLGRISGLYYQDDSHPDEYAFIEDAVAMIKNQLPSREQAPAPASYEYDVFLSFRGEDTREAFASTLCYVLCVGHKVKTFMDVSLRKGYRLEELLKMVEKSRISIVVFSENFTESEWCLKELDKIFEESERRGHEVVPVFYKVHASELRNVQDKGKIKEHMDKHRNKYGKESDIVERWSKAIEDLGYMSGHKYWSGRDKLEVELATEIAQDIWKRLPAKASEQGSTITSSSKLSDIISMVTYQ